MQLCLLASEQKLDLIVSYSAIPFLCRKKRRKGGHTHSKCMSASFVCVVVYRLETLIRGGGVIVGGGGGGGGKKRRKRFTTRYTHAFFPSDRVGGNGWKTHTS